MHLSAWDRMCYSKEYPGDVATPYVAGMDTLSLPTTVFKSTLAIKEANDYGSSSD